jgi:hypothetical protein
MDRLMSSVFAWFTALAVATGSVAPTSDKPAAEGQPEGRGAVVPVELGPPLARRVGVRITVRRAGDDPVMHRPVHVQEFPRPAASDDPVEPIRLSLEPGSYILEAESPGYLPSTRAVTVDTRDAEPINWTLLDDSGHRSVTFKTQVRQDPAPTVTLTARHLAGEQAPVSCTSRSVPCELRLHRGEWEVEARAPGHVALRRVVTVGDAEPQTIALTLLPSLTDPGLPAGPAGPSIPAAAPVDRRKVVLGLSLGAVPLLAGGLALTVSGRVRYAGAINSSRCDSYGKTCADSIIPQIHIGSVGTGLLGASIGLLAAGVTAVRDVPRAAWLAEIGVGGALTVAGGAWMIGNSIMLDRTLKSGPLSAIDARTDTRLAASFFLGAGLGLTVGALTGLLVLHRRRAPKFTPYGGPGHAGLLLSGQF